MKNLKAFLMFLALIWLSGCGAGPASYSLLPASANFNQGSQTVNNKIDILWVVDNSGSMQPLQNNLLNNFSNFISNFQSKGFDFKIAVTTTDAYKSEAAFGGGAQMAAFKQGVGGQNSGYPVITPATPNLLNVFIENADQGDQGDGDERAFSSMLDALNSPLNSGFIRPGAFFAVVILSDEDDFTDPTRPVDSWLEKGGVPDHDYSNPTLVTVPSVLSQLDSMTGSTANARKYNVSAITVADQNCLQSHVQDSPSSIIGQRYIELANDTSGIIGSVCDASYANSLQFIQQRIAELSTTFYLTRTPVPSSIQVFVNSALATQDPNNGWTYNATANAIDFHGTGVPVANSSIQVDFQPTGLN